jgi:outer membrane murein-binding lipoprotein Lpp
MRKRRLPSAILTVLAAVAATVAVAGCNSNGSSSSQSSTHTSTTHTSSSHKFPSKKPGY